MTNPFVYLFNKIVKILKDLYRLQNDELYSISLQNGDYSCKLEKVVVPVQNHGAHHSKYRLHQNQSHLY